MKTYKHENLIYYYDTSLRLWTVHPDDDIEVEAEYFNNKEELIDEYPDFEFEPLNKEELDPDYPYTVLAQKKEITEKEECAQEEPFDYIAYYDGWKRPRRTK